MVKGQGFILHKLQSMRLVLLCLICACLLLVPTWLSAQQTTDDVSQPPGAPADNSVTAVQPPTAGTSAASPPGETPYHPSEPPTGYRQPPQPTITISEGVNVLVNGDNLKLDSDFWRAESQDGKFTRVIANGNVKAVYKNIMVTSTNAEIDLKTNVATFTENVVLQIDNQIAKGAALSLNLNTRDWIFGTAKTELLPAAFPDMIRAPVFISGEKVEGHSESTVQLVDGGFTTCNLDHPHYIIRTEDASVWPSKKLIARHSTLYALGHRLFSIPRLAIPLREIKENQNLLPRVGMTGEEGVFVKTAYGIITSLNNTGYLKLDLMSKKGIGIGFEDNYNLANSKGSFNIYRLSDRNRDLNTLTGRWTGEHKFGDIKANFTSDYRANSYLYAPQSTSFSNELRFSHDVKGSSTSFGIRNSVNSGYSRFETLTSTFQHSQNWGSGQSMMINLDYFRNENPLTIDGKTVTAANAQLNSNLSFTNRNKLLDWTMRISRINDLSNEAFISQMGTRFAGTERLPELAFSTSSSRLGKKTLVGLPLNFDVAVGQYREDFGRVNTNRMVTNMEVPSQVYKLADKLNLTAGGAFRQYVYGNDTAQYSIESAFSLTRKIGDKSNAALSYRYLRPRGYTPFRFDFIGDYNILDARFNIQETDKFKMSLFTGYDFGQQEFPWQDITTRIAYAPSERYLLYTSVGYNLNRSQWRTLINQLRVRLPHDIKFDVGSRYDIEQHKFSSLKTEIDARINDLWRVRANAGYNGYTNAFDYRNIQLVRDLHCWEMTLTYVDQTGIWQDRGIRLGFRIKAFPLFDTFGVGQFGQSLDTSVGEAL
jgi:LPS-assembly protein